MPAGAAAHLRDLINNSAAKMGRSANLKVVSHETVDEIVDPIVASAFAQAEEEIAELDQVYAQREHQIVDRVPAPLQVEAAQDRSHDLAKRIEEVVQDALGDGVVFSAKVQNEPE